MSAKMLTILTLFALIGSLLLSACSTQEVEVTRVIKETVVEKETVVIEPTAVPEEKPVWWVPEGEEVKILYWHSMTEKEASDLEELRRFEETHPRIKVELQVYPAAEFNSIFRAALAGGDPPDVVVLASDATWDFGDEGFLVDISPYLERDLDLNNFFPAATQKIQGCDGNYYGIGRNWVASVILYNQDLFDEAGLSYPDESWTWQDFRLAAKQLTKDTDGDGTTDQWGAVVAPDHLQADPIIWAFGGRVYDPADNQVHFSDSKSVEAMQFLADMILVDQSAPPGALVTGWGQAREDPFATGKVAMRINGTWMLGRYRDLTEFRWAIAPLPEGPEGRYCYVGSDNLYITKRAQEKGITEQAWELMRWLLTLDGGVTWYTSANPGHMPGNRVIAESSQYRAAITEYLDEIEVVKFAGEFGVNPFTKDWREWRTTVNAIFNDAFNGLMTIEEAARLADQETNAILANWECNP